MKPPREIFLQVEDGCPFNDTTWCQDQINDADIRYVLAATADAPPEVTEEIVEVVRGNQGDEGMWHVYVNGKYLHRELYKGDADGIAWRLRAALGEMTK